MEYYNNNLDLIGNTPLVRIAEDSDRSGPLILAKLEYFNPGGSVKDRMVKYVVEKALKEGKLKKGDTIIDNTSGNTGISMAVVAAVYGLKALLTTPGKTSQEKVDTLRALGAEVIVTPTEAAWDDPRSCYQMAKRIAGEKGYFYLNQYDSQDNIMAHYYDTGPEIWRQTEGRITHLVAGIGTGGTLSGAARFLKEQNPRIKSIAVDPEGSLFAEYIKSGKSGPSQTYMVEGIGSDMVTQALDPAMVDEVVTVSDDDSFATARMLARRYGILAGGSSGTAAFAAFKAAKNMTPDDVVVVIFADSALRYITKCFSDKWMTAHGFQVSDLRKEKV
jgi:cystathionine beta-synthase